MVEKMGQKRAHEKGAVAPSFGHGPAHRQVARDYGSSSGQCQVPTTHGSSGAPGSCWATLSMNSSDTAAIIPDVGAMMAMPPIRSPGSGFTCSRTTYWPGLSSLTTELMVAHRWAGWPNWSRQA